MFEFLRATLFSDREQSRVQQDNRRSSVQPLNNNNKIDPHSIPLAMRRIIPLLNDLKELYADGQVINTDYVVQLVRDLGIDVYNDMLDKDGHVFACARQLRSNAAALPWRVISANPDSDTANEHAEFLTDVLEQFQFRQMLKDLFKSELIGFSVIQPIFQTFTWKGKKKWKLKKYIHHKERIFGFDVHGNVQLLDENGKAIKLPDNFFLISVNSTEAYGDPLLKHAYAAFFFKRAAIKLAMSYLEKWGDPPLIGYHQDDTQRDQLIDALEIMKSEAVGSFPKGSEITAMTPGHEVAWEKFFTFFNDEISKVILSGTRTMSGSAAAGAYSATAEHGAQQVDREWELADSNTPIINEFCRHIITLNYGVQDEYPKFVWGDEKQEDAKEFTDRIVSLWTAGVPVELSKQQIREVLGLAAPVDDYDSLLPTGPAMPAGGGQTNFQEGSTTPRLSLNSASKNSTESLSDRYQTLLHSTQETPIS